MIKRHKLSIATPGRSLTEITDDIARLIASSNVKTGICNIFIKHTSASLIICENADPDVLVDLENYAQRLVQDGDPQFVHTLEGVDDMAAHIRSVLTQASISIPVENGRLDMGTWQGLFLWEHRTRPHSRDLVITLYG